MRKISVNSPNYLISARLFLILMVCKVLLGQLNINIFAIILSTLSLIINEEHIESNQIPVALMQRKAY